jgi:arylsulfatase A-like enzyme
VTTLAEIMRAKGYRTGGFVTNTFLSERFHFDQGFDTYVESGVVERLEEPSATALWRSLALVQIVDRLRGRIDPGYDPSFETALAWIQESDRPAFFFVHLMDVHSPYVPPHPFGPRFGATPEGHGDGPRNRFGWRPSEEAYLAEIRFADHKIGRLRRVLEDRGILDDGVLVLTSDHGENMRDHEPTYTHGQTLFDSTLRILAAIRAPAHLSRRGLVASTFENVDVIPTLATLLEWEASSEWEGRGLEDLSRHRATYSQINRDFAVRTPVSKLILKNTGEWELYALDADPGETEPRDVSPEQIERMEQGLGVWLDEHTTELYRERARSVSPDELSPEVIEKLRGLGYLD